MKKQEIREFIREKKHSLSKDTIVSHSSLVMEKLLEDKHYQNAKVIYTYVSYNEEIDTYQLISHSLKNGKKVAVPKIIDGRMEFVYIQSLNDLKKGYQGIMEPSELNIATEPSVLIIMPGLAFDRQGSRIGYGKGFYDKYLERNKDKSYYLLALAYDFQVLDVIPSEAHDRKVNQILTPTTNIISNPNTLFT